VYDGHLPCKWIDLRLDEDKRVEGGPERVLWKVDLQGGTTVKGKGESTKRNGNY
jgi:hypothetical protein